MGNNTNKELSNINSENNSQKAENNEKLKYEQEYIELFNVC